MSMIGHISFDFPLSFKNIFVIGLKKDLEWMRIPRGRRCRMPIAMSTKPVKLKGDGISPTRTNFG